MARVPVIDNLSVLPDAGSSGRFNAAPSTAAAALPFEQMQQLGQATQAAAGTAAKIAIDAQQEANRVRVIEATSLAKERALRLTYDEKDGLVGQKGSAVLPTNRQSGMPLADEYVDRFNKELQTVESSLTNDAQRAMFREQGVDLMTSFRATALKHEAQESKTWRMSTYAGAAKTSASNVTLNYRDPDVIAKERDNIAVAVRAIAAENGQQGSADADIKSAQSALVQAAVSAAMDNGDVSYGVGLYQKWRDTLDGDTLLKLDGLVTAKDTEMAAMTAVRDAMGGVTSAVGGAMPVRGARPIEGGTVTGKFGDKRPGHTHNGVDLATPPGGAVRAQMDGEVIAVWEDGANGKAVKVRYRDGSVHGFAHLSEQGVAKGDRITAGETIAKTGSTGRSTGPHLHWTVEVGGAKVDPLKWANGHADKGRSASEYSSLESLIAAAEKRVVGEGRQLTPDIAKAIQQEASRAWTIHEQSVKDEQDKTYEDAVGYIDRFGSYDRIPSALKASLHPTDRLKLQSLAEQVKGMRSAGTDIEAWLQLREMSPQQLAGMSRADYLRQFKGRLTDAKLAQGFDMVLDARNSLGGDPKNVTGVLSTNDMMESSARGIGLLPAPGAKADTNQALAYDRFKTAVDERVAAFERDNLQGKRKAGRDEIRAIIDQVTTDTVTLPGGWFSGSTAKPVAVLSDDERARGYVNIATRRGTVEKVVTSQIPVDARLQIIRGLRERNEPVTETNIARYWVGFQSARGTK